MRKRVFGRHLKRDTNERKALFKNLMTELVLHEKITTTEEKAKAIRGQVEKLITKAKRKKEASEYLLQPYLSADAVKKVINDIAPRFASRPGGYTRILKLGNRFSDNASMAIIEWVEKRSVSTDQVTTGPNLELTNDEVPVEIQDIQEAEIVTEKPTKTLAGKATRKANKISTTKKMKTEEKKTTKKKAK